MLVSHFMITYSFAFGKYKGSSYLLRAHGKGGASATILSFLSVPPPEKSAGGFQQAGKKEGGLGEGIFARLLTAPKARLGWERLRSLASPREARQTIFQFLLEEKNRRAQNQKSKGNFSARHASGASGGGTGRQFRSKKVRAFSNKGHQTGFVKFLEVDREECSPRLRARLARNWAVKSYGGTKSQDAIFSEMRRFVIPKLCVKINFCSNFLSKISRFAELRRFFIPSPNTCLTAGR